MQTKCSCFLSSSLTFSDNGWEGTDSHTNSPAAPACICQPPGLRGLQATGGALSERAHQRAQTETHCYTSPPWGSGAISTQAKCPLSRNTCPPKPWGTAAGKFLPCIPPAGVFQHAQDDTASQQPVLVPKAVCITTLEAMSRRQNPNGLWVCGALGLIHNCLKLLLYISMQTFLNHSSLVAPL